MTETTSAQTLDRLGVGFERSSVGQALTSVDGRLLRVNAAFAKMLKYAPAALEGRTFTEVTHPDDRAAGAEAAELVLAGAEAARFEKRYLAGDGTTVWADVSVALLRDPGGNPQYFIGTFVDVTERKRAEQRLEASEVRYRRLFEAAKDGILILDAETGEVVDVNPFLIELTGYTREEFLGAHLWELGPFKDTAASKSLFAELQARRYVRYADLPLEARDGRKIDVEFVSNVYRVGSQDVVQCNIRDITARARTEAERDRLITAIEQAAEVVLITDAQGNIIYANPVFEKVTGYSRDEVLGRNPRLLKSGTQDAEFYRGLWTTISGGKTWHGRIVNKKKDGTLFTEDSSVSPVRNPAGVITSYVAVQRDITRELALEAQFLQAQKMEGLGKLAGGVAHDFNNLLTVILTYTGLAASALPNGDPLVADLLAVQKAGERAAGLTRQLLAFSRKQVMQPESLDLNGVLAELEKMFRRIVGEDIDLAQVQTPGLWRVRADPGQIEQVLMNLVVNARDAMPEGGKLTLETSNVEVDEEYASRHVFVEPGPYVVLAVTDTGCGMDERTRARLFEPFFTTKEKGRGTGLGLSTVYGIVKQSGGNIWVYSEPGQGTTFKVYLPRELAPAVSKTVKVPARLGRPTGSETILVVDDEEAVRKVAVRALEAAGYRVLSASDADEAIQICKQHPGDLHLLVTDVVMPRVNGRELALELARLRPTLKVLFMSGYTDDAILHHGVLEPGTPFLEKPFTAAHLARKVRAVLDSGTAGGQRSTPT